MRWLTKISLRLRSLFHRRAADGELDSELRFHLERQIAANVSAGMSPAEARRAALREFGGVEQLKEECHDMRKINWLQDLAQDLRYGLRMLRKSPGFTAVAILTLALGIGANTTIFSLMNTLMLRDLPVKNPSQLVLLGTESGSGDTSGIDTDLYSYRFYKEMERRNRIFSESSAMMSVIFGATDGRVAGATALESMKVQLVSGTYFSMLGVHPVLGQAFTRADDEPLGAHADAMISYAWWTRRFARDPSVVGRTISINSTVYTIIGVTPQGFFGTMVGEAPDVWIPLSMEKQVSPGWNGLEDKWWDSLYIVGRLKPGISVSQAQAGINVLAKAIWRDFAGATISPNRQKDLDEAWIDLTPAARGLSRLRKEYSLPLQVLMALVGLVLLIACANIANLLLARSTNRRREMALRLVVGASRIRLFRQLFTESLLLACLGGALGILFAAWADQALLAWVSGGTNQLPLNLGLDPGLLAFTFGVTLVAALLFGTLPALRGTRIGLTDALKSGGGIASAARRSRLTQALIVAQVALSFVLLMGAGLFLRTLRNFTHVNTGFNEKNVLLFGIGPSAIGYKIGPSLVNLYQRVEQRVGAQPGIRADSISLETFNQGEWKTSVSVLGGTPALENNPHVVHNVVGHGYFATMGIPFLLGRTFGPQDTATSPKVVVINETMARLYFPGGSPIGRQFEFRASDTGSARNVATVFEVIGVVKDAKYDGLDGLQEPAAYYVYTQVLPHFCYDFEVRYSGDPRAIIAEVRSAAAEVEPDLPVTYGSTLEQQVKWSLGSQSLVARLSMFFGLVAVCLASIGIYGLISYGVSRRTNEIGIRMALGAPRMDVFWMVLREGVLLAGAGLLVGVPLALASGRFVASMLFGVKPADLPTMVGAAALLVLVAFVACYIPARRAMRIDPMVALRYE